MRINAADAVEFRFSYMTRDVGGTVLHRFRSLELRNIHSHSWITSERGHRSG